MTANRRDVNALRQGKGVWGLVAGLLIVGCNGAEVSPGRGAPTALHTFEAAFTEVGSVELEQSDSTVIAQVVGVVIDTKGNIVLGDGSESDIKVYAPDGSFIARIARRGEGPGEVPTAAVPSVAPDGEIHASIFARNQVLVFTSDYAFSRTILLDSIAALGSTAMTDVGTYLSVGLRTVGRAVLESDAVGRFLAWYVVADSVPVRDRPASPVWGAFAVYGAAQVGDTILVTHSLADSLWRLVRGRPEATTALAMTFPGYREPRIPEVSSLTQPGGPFASMDVFHPPRPLGSSVIVPVGRGRFLDSDSNLVVVIDGTVPMAYANAPPILTTDGDELIALDPHAFVSGRVVLRRYRRVPPEFLARVTGALPDPAVAITPTEACGTQPKVATRELFIGLSTEHCLSCEGVGFHLRRISRKLREDGTPLGVFSPVEDVSFICRWLREERVAARVVPVTLTRPADSVFSHAYFTASAVDASGAWHLQPYRGIEEVDAAIARGVPRASARPSMVE